MQVSPTDSTLMHDLMAFFTAEFFAELGTSDDKNSPISMLPQLQSLILLIAQPAYQCPMAQAYVTPLAHATLTNTEQHIPAGMPQSKAISYKDSLFIPSSVPREEVQLLIGVFSRGVNAF